MIIIETILKILKAFRKSNIIETIIAMQAALLSVIVLLQVVFRYLLNSPLAWTEEASRFLLIWIVLLGAAIGIKRKSHFTVDIFFKKLPPKLQQSLQFALDIFLFILIFDVMIINGVYLSHLTLRQISPALHIRMSYVYSAVLVGGILSCCYILEDILTHIKEGITKNQNRIIEKGS
ncbi:MAG: TRAP transporter small permease [Atribacterota bacterium]|nr:TRAP transporter small permease [Atribacterota bacterium]MDD5636975.1 TRAP transporter small permease [Atribacterota bacterium]